jgi:nucleoside-diphosphate-sugar epimerase
MTQTRVLVTGAGGFIGHHLVTFLRKKGYWVRGRNSDNTRLREVLKWEPQLSLEAGLQHIYSWIEKQVALKLGMANS